MANGKICVIKDQSLFESSSAYKVLENILYEVVGIDRGNVVIRNIETFVNLNNIDADVIIAVGEPILSQLCNLKGILRYAGQVLDGPVPVVPIVSPGYLEHNPNYLMKFAEDIQTAYQVSIGIAREEVSNQYCIVEDLEMLKTLIKYTQKSGYCSFDFETTELTDMNTFDPDFYPTCLSISFQQGSSYVIPLWHRESKWSDKELEEIFQLLEEGIFGNPSITKIGHNVKFDLHVLAWCGITQFRAPYHDTMLLHQLYDENSSHKLKDIVRAFYLRFANYEKALGNKNWADIPLDKLAKYNAIDSDVTLRLYWYFTDLLLDKDDGRLYLMYRNLTAPATKILFFMEENGMLINKEFLINSINEVSTSIAKQEALMREHPEVKKFEAYQTNILQEQRIDELQKKCNKERQIEYKSKNAQKNQVERITAWEDEISQLKAGYLSVESYRVNFSSPEQLKDLLFGDAGFNFPMPDNKYSKLKADSTGADNLGLIKDKSGFLEELQVYRQLSKIHSTYLSSILGKLDQNHYIHTSFNQHGTKTGRLSARDPNLQNIITRTKYKSVEDAVALVKRSFIPPERHVLVQADYSQMELRIVAMFANETNMLEAYRTKQDLHEITGANSLGYTLEEFRKLDPKLYKNYRFQAKAENFGFVYSMSPKGFKEYARTDYGINISLREAEHKREAFFKKYPKLLDYYKEYIGKARKFGYVRTFFGRKIRLPDVQSINSAVRSHAERNAINGPIQGTAGEITIFSLPFLYYRLSPRVQIVNEIHDAIYFYVPVDILDESLIMIKMTMENLPFQGYFGKTIDAVPICVDIKTSTKSWKDVEEK